MKTIGDRLVYGSVKGSRFTTSEGHVGNGTLVLGLASGGELLASSLELGLSSFRSKVNTSNDIAHGATAVATKDLDGDDVGSLSNTVLCRGDSTSTMSAVTVAVLVNIVLRDGSAP